MAFHDVRLPEKVEKGVQGGPRFNTTVFIRDSGNEVRNENWQYHRGEWDAGYGIQEQSEYEEVLQFFYARRGRAHSFRFKDWSDFKLGFPTPQVIGTGDGSEVDFQIYKRYSSGGYDYDRPITKPIASTLKVYVDDVEQVSGWTLDALTGIITFDSPVTDTHAVAVQCEFDVPVRFDTDVLDIAMQVHNVSRIPSIPLVEVRVA